MENIWGNVTALFRKLIKEITWLSEIYFRNALLIKNLLMSAYS